jgi:predicted RNA-binding Zn ribbon-like protein
LGQAATRAVADADAVVTRAVRLRSALYAILIGPATDADWAVVDSEVRRAAREVALRPGTPAGWTLTTRGLAWPLSAVAWAAGQFLTTDAAGTVSACPSADCGWVFANPTGRRRWCRMALCGNRAKARRHAQRRRVPGR